VRLQATKLAIGELAQRLEVLAGRLNRDSAELTATEKRLNDPVLSIEQAQRTCEGAQNDSAAADATAKDLRTEIEALERSLATINTEIDSIREQRARSELAMKEVEIQKKVVEDSVQERFGVGLDLLLGDVPAEDCDEGEIEVEIEDCRNAIRRLGSVNVGAVAELEEIESRLKELVGQRDDLERSIDDLRGTIARLNRMSRERFKETFDAVNGVFRDTFPRLFQGGDAWLALTDESNLLETGVEIFVRPPGKKVGNLNLLSGGEKALTAVSLIFSLFLYKPSPFCVLDEVDAPLDDANVGRFARMITEMSDRSQFVLITHNKRTMEGCDVLYGVTMQEPGISKIVSVQLT
jgi:chromosome segregation protein